MNKLDTIDVKLHSWEHEGRTYERIDLILNGEVVAGTFDPVEFAVPRVKKAELYIRTCSCGVPGCAGIWGGVIVKRKAKTVEWRDTDTSFPKKFYAFDQYLYTSVQNKTISLMREIAELRDSRKAKDGDEEWDHYDGVLRFTNVDQFETDMKRADLWFKSHNT